MRLQLHTFGELSLRNHEGEVVAFPQKALIAIAYLLSDAGASVSRVQMARFLWEEADPSAALVNLRKLTSRVRARQQEIAIDILSIGQTDIAVSVSNVEPDFSIFDAGQSGHVSLDVVLQQTRLLSLPFLPDTEAQSRAFNRWRERQLETFSTALRCRFLDAISQGLDLRTNSGLRDAGLLVLERDPGDDVVRQVLVSAALLPDPGMARRSPRPVEPRAKSTLHAGGETGAQAAIVSGEDRAITGFTAPRIALLPPSTAQWARSAQLGCALVEDVTIALCASRTLSVVAPYTAEQISLQSDKADSFERYSIQYVLDTRLMEEEKGQSFYAQLVFFGTDQVLWARRFDIRDMGLLEARRDISLLISKAISSEIGRSEAVRQTMERDPAAYRDYLLATRHAKQLNLPGVRRARRLYRQAFQANPDMTPALSGLARSHFLEWLLTARADRDLLQRAEDLALEAVALAPDDVFGHRELGVVRLYKRDFDGSLDALEHAERSSPQFADILASRADTLVQASRPQEGLTKIRQAIELNPLCPDEYFWTAAGASYSSEEYEQALTFIGQMKERRPADRLAAACYAMLGNSSQARRLVRKTLLDNPGFALEKWLTMVPFRESWQREHYREGLIRAGYR